MLVDRHVKRLEVPGEPGEWMELRRLNFGDLRDLRQQSGERFLEDLSGLPSDVLEMQLTVQAKMAEAKKAARAAAEESGEEADDDLPDPDVLDGMDLLFILGHGIVAWSYREESGEPVPIAEAVGMLDEETARWAAREILLVGKEVAEREKKGSPSSTDTSTE